MSNPETFRPATPADRIKNLAIRFRNDGKRLVLCGILAIVALFVNMFLAIIGDASPDQIPGLIPVILKGLFYASAIGSAIYGTSGIALFFTDINQLLQLLREVTDPASPLERIIAEGFNSMFGGDNPSSTGEGSRGSGDSAPHGFEADSPLGDIPFFGSQFAGFGPATVIIGADGEIPPEEVERVLNAFSSIDPDFIQRMLGDVVGGMAGGGVIHFGAGEFPKAHGSSREHIVDAEIIDGPADAPSD